MRNDVFMTMTVIESGKRPLTLTTPRNHLLALTKEGLDRATAAMPGELAEEMAVQLRDNPNRRRTPAAEALADPGQVVRCMILDAMKMFVRAHDNKEPAKLHLTPEMEALLDHHARYDGGATVREMGQLFGKSLASGALILDSSDFRLE